MTPEQIALVQTSFSKVAPISDKAAEIFYGRLFDIAPDVTAMFPADMTEQRKKLMATLAYVVNGLDKLDTVLPAASYGVTASHYAPVGAALLWTLERGLGPAWTPEVSAAWTAAYTTLAGFMIGEAYSAPQAVD
jgi:nitric oxide dioxygenase